MSTLTIARARRAAASVAVDSSCACQDGVRMEGFVTDGLAERVRIDRFTGATLCPACGREDDPALAAMPHPGR